MYIYQYILRRIKKLQTFGVNIHSQNLSLFWDAELFRCALKTVRNFRSSTSFDHLRETD